MHKPGLAFQSWGRQILDGRFWCWILGYLLSNSLLRHEDVLSVREVAMNKKYVCYDMQDLVIIMLSEEKLS
jgi:hypothetical protein